MKSLIKLIKQKNTITKRYRKNVDEAYDLLDQIAMFILDVDKLKEIAPDINNLKTSLNGSDYDNAISIMDGLFDKLGEISGTEEFADAIDELISLIDEEEMDQTKVSEKSSEVIAIFDKEINWRSDASKNLMPKLIEYDSALKETIGLRLQSKLTKEQAIYVSRCNSIHRDISLNF